MGVSWLVSNVVLAPSQIISAVMISFKYCTSLAVFNRLKTKMHTLPENYAQKICACFFKYT